MPQWGAGMRTIANGDSVPGMIPLSAGYTFVDGGFHVYGTNASASGPNRLRLT